MAGTGKAKEDKNIRANIKKNTSHRKIVKTSQIYLSSVKDCEPSHTAYS